MPKHSVIFFANTVIFPRPGAFTGRVYSDEGIPVKDDRQLVEACLAGEVQAFAALVDRYRYPVYGICLGYTKDFDAAEDAAQEAFIAS